MPSTRMSSERGVLEELIQTRTEELNHINDAWDQKVSTVLSAEAKPAELERLAGDAPREDYYLLRLISEHPRVTSRTLSELAKHPYAAIKENVARHPNTDGNTLVRLSKDRSHPLWYLVAFNPNTPADLRQKLRERMAKLGDAPGNK